MIKSELVECVMRSYPGLYQRDAETAVDAVLDAIADALAEGNRVEIRGFGAFSAKERRSRVGRNPRTGQRVPVAAKRVPMFKASKEIREALNHGSASAPRPRKTVSTQAGHEADGPAGD
jgi:integration host factor subunit beta